jgi:hypothetical protein
MKNLFLAVLIGAMAIGSFTGCKKTQSLSSEDTLIRDARDYCQAHLSNFYHRSPDSNMRISGAKTLDWGQARVANLSKVLAVVVPIHYTRPFYLGTNFGGSRLYAIDGLAQLVIYRDSAATYHTEMVTALPESNYKGLPHSAFTGMLLVDQWNGQALARYKYDGHPARVWRPGAALGKTTNPIKQPDALLFQTCYEIVGYNYPESNPSAGYAWQEDVGCTNSFIDETPGTVMLNSTDYTTTMGGGGVGPYFNPSAMYPGDGGIVDGANLTFLFDTLPGIDLARYFKCFTYIPDQGATYSVTVCADLPVDNNSGALLTTNLHPGHAFLILTKTNGIFSLSQSFGFYPQNSLSSAFKAFVSSKIGDDGVASHEYDASIAMPSISKLDFQTVENMAVNLANSQQYSLYNYNCTNYALQVYNSIRVNNPITVSDWIGSYTGINFGSTPNGLYETLVSMKTLFPNANNPNITVGPKYAPASAGACN